MRRTLVFSLIAILGFNFAALKAEWYHAFWWLDVLMHMIGGAWVGLFFYYLFVERFNVIDRNQKLALFVLGIGFVALVGIFWEFYEFLTDIFILKAYPYNREPGYILYDTHTDFVNDFIGGAIALLVLMLRKKTDNAH
ncbi:hypothetical protein C4571_02820 [Candidatus Parcubacteria bacterium]|nr:MAG: hypothetical protein C4571_02820 [Candidatus Parcubacteria bacterium]